MLDQSGDEQGRATQGVKHWGTSRQTNQLPNDTVPMHEKTIMSTKVGFHDNNGAFMRSGDLSTRSRNQSDILQNSTMHQPNTGFNKSGLKIEGSPMGIKTGHKEPLINTPLLPPMPPPPMTVAKAPSRTYAYQVSQLSVNEKQESVRNVDLKNVTGASKRANPKVVVSNTTKGAIHHSTSKDILNDDMREVFSAGSKLA